jgi:hypothetical protein
MKIELIKEESMNGDIYYSVEMDGVYIKSSLSNNYEKALEKYEKIKKGELDSKEILKSEEI